MSLHVEIDNTTSRQGQSPRRLSAEEYDRRRLELVETYGSNPADISARWEQAFAKLLCRSGWSIRELADKEGMSKSQVDRSLRFGRFIQMATASPTGGQSVPPNGGQTASPTGGQRPPLDRLAILAERTFRAFWEQTDMEADEKARFDEVLKLMAEHTVPPKGLARTILEKFSDGKWHPEASIIMAVDAEAEQVRKALKKLQKGHNQKVECKPVGKTHHWRIFSHAKVVGSQELREKLTPIIAALMVEGKKNMATISLSAVLYQAGTLKKLVDEWTK